nr:unnamed protein product [Callosobruchus analis]
MELYRLSPEVTVNPTSMLQSLCIQRVFRSITNWEVKAVRPSNHRHIYFEISGEGPRQDIEKKKQVVDWEKLDNLLKEKILQIQCGKVNNLDDVNGILCNVYQSSCIRVGKDRGDKPHRWNTEIEAKRKERVSTLRAKMKSNRGDCSLAIKAQKEQYKNKKKELRVLTRKSKEQLWKDICDEINDDIWGNGYKIVTRHTKHQHLPYSI